MMLFLIVTFLIIHLYKKFNSQNFHLKVSKEKVLQRTRSQENPLEIFSFPVKREKANSQKGKHICSIVNDFQMEFLTTIKTVSLLLQKSCSTITLTKMFGSFRVFHGNHFAARPSSSEFFPCLYFVCSSRIQIALSDGCFCIFIFTRKWNTLPPSLSPICQALQ